MGPKKNTIKMVTDPAETRAKLLNDKLASIEADISNKGEMIADDAIKAMYLAFFGPNSPFNIKTMYKKLIVVEEKVEKSLIQDKYISSLEEKIKILEIENHQNKVILRNIPFSNPKERKEKFSDTKITVEGLLAISGQKIESLNDYYRLFPKKGAENNSAGKVPPILISFRNIFELRKFTKCLSNIKKEEKYQNMIMEHSCPPSLKTEYHLANKEAFKLRRDKKMVTRCIITKTGIKLLIKNQGEEKFTQVQYPKE